MRPCCLSFQHCKALCLGQGRSFYARCLSLCDTGCTCNLLFCQRTRGFCWLCAWRVSIPLWLFGRNCFCTAIFTHRGLFRFTHMCLWTGSERVVQVSNWLLHGFVRMSLFSINEKPYSFRIDSQQVASLPLPLQQNPVGIKENRR